MHRMKLRSKLLVVAALGAAMTIAASTAAVAIPTVVMISVNTQGQPANGLSGAAATSQDGRFVAFQSTATDLVADDTNGKTDIFWRDMETGHTKLVSVGMNGRSGNGDSAAPAISGDGNCVIFYSDAPNLTPQDRDGYDDVFLRHMDTGVTEMISRTYDGSVQDGDSHFPSVSADCKFAAFRSRASNLVPGDTNNKQDIFYRDVVNKTTTRASVAWDGGNANKESRGASIASNGRYVAFHSYATNLIEGGVNANGKLEVYVRDMVLGVTTRVSVDMDGGDPNCDSRTTVGNSLSDDARYVVFQSCATDLIVGDGTGGREQIYDTFIKDLQTGVITRMSTNWHDGGDTNGDSRGASISGDGTLVAYHSSASNIVPNDGNGHRDIFVWNRLTGETVRASVDYLTGGDSNSTSKGPSVSSDGHYVSFGSVASDLVAGDNNGQQDVFRLDLTTLI